MRGAFPPPPEGMQSVLDFEPILLSPILKSFPQVRTFRRPGPRNPGKAFFFHFFIANSARITFSAFLAYLDFLKCFSFSLMAGCDLSARIYGEKAVRGAIEFPKLALKVQLRSEHYTRKIRAIRCNPYAIRCVFEGLLKVLHIVDGSPPTPPMIRV